MQLKLKLGILEIDLGKRLGNKLTDESGNEFDLAALLAQSILEIPSPRFLMDKETLGALRRQTKGGPFTADVAETIRQMMGRGTQAEEFITKGRESDPSFKDGEIPTYRGIVIFVEGDNAST